MTHYSEFFTGGAKLSPVIRTGFGPTGEIFAFLHKCVTDTKNKGAY